MGIFDFFKPKDTLRVDITNGLSSAGFKDIGVITHFNGKPFSGTVFRMNDKKNVDLEIEFKDGLKREHKIYYKDGKIMRILSYDINEKMVSFNFFDKMGVKIVIPFISPIICENGADVINDQTSKTYFLNNYELTVYNTTMQNYKYLTTTKIPENPKITMQIIKEQYDEGMYWLKKNNKNAYLTLLNNNQTKININNTKESYIDLNQIIDYRTKKFGNQDHLKKISGAQKKIFLSIYEYINLRGMDNIEEPIFLEDIQLFLLNIFSIEESNKLLNELEAMKIIYMPSFYSYQIFPVNDSCEEWIEFNIAESNWSEYYPYDKQTYEDFIFTNWSKHKNSLQTQISCSVFKNKNGYLEKDEHSYFDKIKQENKDYFEVNPSVKIYNNSEVTFKRIDQNGIWILKENDEAVCGIVFSLYKDRLEDNLNGKLWFITTYDMGIKNGIQVCFSSSGNIEKLWTYEKDIEVDRKEYDLNGKLLVNRDSICYIDRSTLLKSNLREFYSTTDDHLQFVVMDMSTKKVVFTSDSQPECDQWIKNGK